MSLKGLGLVLKNVTLCLDDRLQKSVEICCDSGKRIFYTRIDEAVQVIRASRVTKMRRTLVPTLGDTSTYRKGEQGYDIVNGVLESRGR
jgi:hypothetical protein